MRDSGPTIRSRLVLLVLISTLPMLVFSATLLDHAYRVSAGLIEQNAVAAAGRVAAAVEAQLGRAEAIGVALSQLPSRDVTDLAAFEAASLRALQTAGLNGTLDVIDAEGNIVAQTGRLDQEPLGRDLDADAVSQVFATKKPVISGVSVGLSPHQPQVTVHVPLLRNGAVTYDLALHLPTRSIAAAGLPERWFVVISDAEARIVFDTSEPGEQAGDALPPDAAALYAGREQGFAPIKYRNREDILLGFVRSERTGWTVGVGVPSWVVFGPLLRSIGTLAAGGATVLLMSLALAWVIGRNIIRPLNALKRQALALASAQTLEPDASFGLAEAEAAAQALREAASELRARETEREAARRRAETSEARLLLAQEIGKIGTWEIDLVTGERSWSQQLFELFGRDPALGAPEGNAVLALVHPDDRAAIADGHERARAEPMSYHLVFRVLRPDGTLRWLHTAARSEFKDGKPLRVLGTTIDTTEQLEAQRVLRESAARLEAEVAARTEQLAQSEDRFRTYFQHSSDALVVMLVEDGPTFVYETINRSAERLFGHRHDEIVGRTPEEVLAPELVAQVVAVLRQALTSQGPLTVQRTMAFAGDPTQFETIFVPVVSPATGRVVRIISGSRDITDRQRMEGRLAHAQRLEAVGQLTGGVAHDFNNLLTVVIGNLSLLRSRLGDDARAQRYLASVEAAAERGAKLTSSLLAFSRRQALQVEQLDIGERIRESTTLLRRALGEEIEFSLEIEPGLAPANVDASKLEAAVLNLVINARDAIEDAMAARSERGGQLRVSVQAATLAAADLEGNDEAKPGRFIAIRIRDSGVGMSALVRARAFEPFFTTKEVGRGTGLGLSQVFGFVRQLGGHVTIDGAPGSGTQVTMFLPEAARELPVLTPAKPEPSFVPVDATLLVVEDDPNICDVTAEMLRDAGFRVRTAASGPAALDILRSGERVDLLFTDVVLPGGATGVDLARSVRELRPHLAVLLTSGYDGAALSRLGADHTYEILAKPYTRPVLVERISAILAASPVA